MKKAILIGLLFFAGGIAEACLPGAHWGIHVIDAKTSQVMRTHQADQRFIPASITKLFTAATALETLSPDARFHTVVKASDYSDSNGHIAGNLYLTGGADPSLTGNDLRSLAKKVHEAGVRVIHGNVIVDDSLFQGPVLPTHGEWEDLKEAFAPEVSALSVNGNVIQGMLAPGKHVGRLACLQVDQEIPYCRVINQVITVKEGAQKKLSFSRSLESNVIEVKGQIPIDASAITKRAAIHHPEEYARRIFVKALQELGIKLNGKHYADCPSKANEIARHSSAPLSHLLVRMNKISDNLYAEMIHRFLNIKQEVPPLELLMDRLRIQNEDYKFYDGSGLSRHNLTTPLQVVKLLAHANSSSYKDIFFKTLPINGKDGSLENRLENLKGNAVVRAKTGGMAGVSNLAGYIDFPDGREFIFAAFINYSTKTWNETSAALDELLRQIIAELASESRSDI